MLNSKSEYEALLATINTSGWSILKREYEDLMASSLSKAKQSTKADDCFVEMQRLDIAELMVQLPYILLNQHKGDFE